ncbi:pyridoxamine 5'-phosphate oxidase family protein [Nonomuraea cavernae]|uniref:Pyridoxamine 5'-phosphate oxidase n=1 Tax=Nonomuraea cavernae TaxID=2045107 RepID=A0A917Z4J0_9ACTN|nr:pyridoxamine 5'-phosphate oxidase family protein [Nonomuraea cavernae]MCA2188601.1 pyridoxamine 5'-phosphate oxidase family protein [Nonomuraea cavernae]GGO74552.1 pyridoxamine 5'-phosphate oxidase [Nonomuraea cavernae]
MTRPTPRAELLFGEADATPMSTDPTTVKPWSEARACLRTAPKALLSTVRPDGRPHAMPVMPVWADEAPCFATRPASRKGRNLAHNGNCVLTVTGPELDLVLEGVAVLVRDPAQQREVADAFLAKYQWGFALHDGSVHDDSLPGSPEYAFYRVTPLRAYGYGSDGLTATRWRF